MEIKLYNSLSKKLEVFVPLKDNIVTMYVCGPTVYNHMHIGNGRPVVFFDSVRRYFEALGYTVLYVSNFTDIDDKIIKKAKEENVTEDVISNKYIEAYLDLVKKLNCKPNYLNPKVTECMDDIVTFIEKLVDKNHAYTKGNDTFFRVKSVDNYGQLSGQKTDDLNHGSRIDVDSLKEDPSDFILWKKTSDEGIKWHSCLGDGRPGWHTECVVMIDKIFGGMIDIHGGGNDLKFPHHENEIAQSCALNHHTIANYWIHNARIDLSGEKMSKSLGNVIWLKDIIEEYPPQAYRLFVLANHYRQTINYNDELMQKMNNEWEKIEKTYISLYRKIELIDGNFEGNVLPVMDEYLNEMAYDFNTANALSVIYNHLKTINKDLRTKDIDSTILKNDFKTLKDMLDIFGLYVNINPLTSNELELVREWMNARNEKDFEKADILRKEISEKGIVL